MASHMPPFEVKSVEEEGERESKRETDLRLACTYREIFVKKEPLFIKKLSGQSKALKTTR